MFTGIIETTTKVETITRPAGTMRVRFEKPKGWKFVQGQSVAIDGVCSTVVKHGAGFFEVEYMPETLGKTCAGMLTPGASVNLERSLTLKSLVDGHLVQGHVDGRARVVSIDADEDSKRITFGLPGELMPFVVEHGSIAIQGVSLTVAKLAGKNVTVGLIPHTLSHTNLHTLKRGDEVNVEADLVARYLVRGRVVQ